MNRGTKEYGEYCREQINAGCGVMVTEYIGVMRNASIKDGKGRKAWALEVVDIRTGKWVDINTTMAGHKMFATTERGGTT